MKKQVVMVFFMVLILIFGAYTLSGSLSEDYNVIKKAVKGKKTAKDVTVLKILVKDNTSGKVKIKLTLPITLVEMLSECSNGSIRFKRHCRIDFRAIFKELKKMGPHCLIEVDDEDESVKIWLE